MREVKQVAHYSSGARSHFNEKQRRLIKDLGLHATEEALKAIARVASVVDEPEIGCNISLSAAASVFVSMMADAKRAAPEKAGPMIDSVLKQLADALR